MHPLHKLASAFAFGAALTYGASAVYKDTNRDGHVPADVLVEDAPLIVLEELFVTVDPYFCYRDEFSIGRIKDLAALTYTNRKPAFTCEELFAYDGIGGSAEFAKELLSMKDSSGNHLFLGRDIFAYKEAGGTVEYAKKFLSVTDSEGKNIFTGAQLTQLYSLNISVQEALTSKDTAKPDALFIYPASDNNPGLYGRYVSGVFRDANSIKFFNEMKKAYDLKVEVVSEENQFYAQLLSQTEFEYLLLAGHGRADSLDLSVRREEDEKLKIDIYDYELENYLQNLAPNAVIFLYSCSTGEGGDNAVNLANTLAKWAHGRKVIAPKEPLYTNRVAVNSFYPFDAALTDHETGKRDITYTVLFDQKSGLTD